MGDNKGSYKILKTALILFGILGFLGSTILFFNAKYIAYNYLQIPDAYITLKALSPSIFLVTISSVFKGYFNGKKDLKITANSGSIEQIFKTIFTIILVEIVSILSFNDTALMVQAATIGTTLSTFICLLYLYRYFLIRKKEVWKEVNKSSYNKEERIRKIVKDVLVVSVPITLSALFANSTKTIDALSIVRILKEYCTQKEATLQFGILTGKVETLISLPYSFNAAFSIALIPEISSLITLGKWRNAEKKLNFSLFMSLLIGIIYTIIIEVFASYIIRILFPNALNGVEMLKVAALDIIPVVLIQTLSGALHALGKTNTTILAFAIGGSVKVVLNFILVPIPKIGIYGAIIATIISHIISFLICYIVLKKCMNNLLNFKKIIKSYGKKRYKFINFLKKYTTNKTPVKSNVLEHTKHEILGN